MLDYERLTALARECGFTEAGPLDVRTLRFFPEVRDMCATDRCHNYNKNWSCPPACGTLDEMRAKVQAFSEGIIVQTVGTLEDSFDWEATMETAKKHADNFAKMYGVLKKEYPEMFAMGAGTCTKCETCTYVEGKPCRFPDEMTYSMEACGLLVSQVCTDNNIPYNHGPQTVTYTGCYLLRESRPCSVTGAEQEANARLS